MGASGTLGTSGLSRLIHRWGLIRTFNVSSQWIRWTGLRFHGRPWTLRMCKKHRSPRFCVSLSALPAASRHAHRASNCIESRSRRHRRHGRSAQSPVPFVATAFSASSRRCAGRVIFSKASFGRSGCTSTSANMRLSRRFSSSGGLPISPVLVAEHRRRHRFGRAEKTERPGVADLDRRAGRPTFAEIASDVAQHFTRSRRVGRARDP
ncbi:hypothetical protein SAMN04488021_10625 [Paracoccus aminovorans]|uniref:Uncharacterized protein n=1 Tax=Paracoccus aminovorans TaxID=34004 RepID=A0A1I2YWF4_9RHOB|nr:hypothetical protein JCM7685_1213 [Paracoccus aminovorans]SFH29599.1 hypothetical protein SAMN04488021_10625 [Paracoccus aminovorans]